MAKDKSPKKKSPKKAKGDSAAAEVPPSPGENAGREVELKSRIAQLEKELAEALDKNKSTIVDTERNDDIDALL